MRIVRPAHAPKAYELAAEAFQSLYREVTGVLPEVDTQPDKGDLAVIGGDEVNAFARQALLEGWGPQRAVPAGADGYAMVSVRQNGRDILFLWGGRGRSTLYAVYAFFAKQAGCRYFWDGDVIPKHSSVSLRGLSEYAAPDFALRGIRYFAHRGLHRFQAEHWGLEDWKREIDWLLKRGLNFFMLRIGGDDLFQKAFPGLVDYPPAEGALPEAGQGYDDRTLFWPLQYRGRLRRQVLQYAFDRDLMHPEDCGTTTHWYTRTPVQFLERKNPAFLPQVTDVYRQPTGLVWDIREDENLENYFALTRAHIREYGRPQLFHTIGLAERMCAENRQENMRFKKMAYHRILSRVEQEWPGAPVLVASWDFAMDWQPQEVRELLAEFDPARHIIFDYTADTRDEENNFLHWGFYRRFPWVFGIFHAFEPGSDLRGDYEGLSSRLELARQDEQCKGLAFWPELSHSDTLMLEYFAQSAWAKVDDGSFLQNFCQSRYGADAPAMHRAWQCFWPLLKLHVWTLDRGAAIEDMHQECFFDTLGYQPLRRFSPPRLQRWREELTALPAVLRHGAATLRALAPLYGAERKDGFLCRDCADLARTALGRVLHLLLLRLVCGAAQGVWREDACENYKELLALLCDVLDSHGDYSQYETLRRLKQEHPVNSAFEPAFKQNAANGYCRGYVGEFMRWLCTPENEAYLDFLRAVARRAAPDEAELQREKQNLYDCYMARPLADMAPQKPADMPRRLREGAARMDEAAQWLE